MARLFGTDGVRGVAGAELDGKLAYDLGRAGAKVLANAHAPRILIGRDTRVSGAMLEAAMAAGICAMGAEAVIAGVLPTPGIAYLTKKLGFDAGVMISASHNPFEFNGIKFFDGNGYKLPDATEDAIEALIAAGDFEEKQGAEIGRCGVLEDGGRQYIDHVKSTLPEGISGLRIVLDCANGAASCVAQAALTELGAEVVACLACDPDGININAGCGSTHMQKLQQAVKEHKAQAGIAFDGDADRMLAVDENGQLLDGDQIMLFCAEDMAKRGVLARDTVVVTVMTNLGFDIAAGEMGLCVEKTGVGDRYVLERMLEAGYNFGGEQSGHMIFLDHGTTGDGLVSAVQMLGVMARSGLPLSQLAKKMQPMPQVLINARVPNGKKHSFMQDEMIAGEIGSLENKYGGLGRVLIRTSGTEPLVRVMIEGSDQQMIDRDAQALAELITARMAD